MLSRTEQLEFCKYCLNRKFDPKQGLICNLTESVADFIDVCSDYSKDVNAIAKEIAFNEERSERQRQIKEFTFGLDKLGIKNGLLAGIILLIVGSTWLIYGLQYNFIFWYPVVLIVMGFFATLLGLINLYLKKKRKSIPKISNEILDY